MLDLCQSNPFDGEVKKKQHKYMTMCVEKNKAYITNHNTKSVLQENNVA